MTAPKLTLAALTSAAVLLAGCSHTAAPAPETNTPSVSSTNLPAEQVNVTYENNAVSPAELKVNAGTKVLFKNNHTAAVRLSRNPHPMHTGSKEFSGFDSGLLAPSSTYEFTFAVKGTLSYHDHLNPGVMGKVVVE